MSLDRALQKHAKTKFQARPELLLCPTVPQPLHTTAPRAILGPQWWDATRQAAYLSTGHRCAACGVPKHLAPGHKWLEGHEVYAIDYTLGRATYVETVPLCHYCHGYIHRGRLDAMLEQGEISQAKYIAIVQHGDAVLRTAKLIKPSQHGGGDIAWVKWRMVIDGKEYKPKIRSLKAWKKKFNPKRSKEQ